MSTRFRRGLVVGKFSPLHLGHEGVIETARQACDEVLVLSYSLPELPRCAAAMRERWLALRCPQVQRLVLDDARLARLCSERGLPPRQLPDNQAADEVHRHFVGSLLWDLLQTTVDAVFTSESYGDGFAASLTRQFQSRQPAHPVVTHVSVDPGRQRRPVSGTAVRAAPGAWREQVAPEVWADLVPRLCLLGGESSGKTTLAQALAQALDTVWVPEYGRERWVELGGVTMTPEQLLHVAREQVAREIAAAPLAKGWLVCDTSPLTTLQYCLIDHGHAPDDLHDLARRPYDLVVLCDGDFGFVQDGTRRDEAFRALQQTRTIDALQRQGVRHLVVTGSVEERVAQVLRALNG
ncbi:AAA family ATPase [Ideonella sp. DXS29W]|uniref:AAA family ATPase n=1 Tax=Ideonella lacteola TaxID=2984193 RepID=A0ABU9BHY5_9BURK